MQNDDSGPWQAGRRHIPTMASVVLEKAKILLAIPCMENAYDETDHILPVRQVRFETGKIQAFAG